MSARLVAAGLALLGVVAGCRSPEDDPATYRDLVRQQVEAKEEMIDVLATVKDKESMAAALVKLKELGERVEPVVARLRELPRPSPKVDQALKEELAERLQAGSKREGEEVRRIRSLPGGEAFFKEVARLKPGGGF